MAQLLLLRSFRFSEFYGSVLRLLAHKGQQLFTLFYKTERVDILALAFIDQLNKRFCMVIELISFVVIEHSSPMYFLPKLAQTVGGPLVGL